ERRALLDRHAPVLRGTHRELGQPMLGGERREPPEERPRHLRLARERRARHPAPRRLALHPARGGTVTTARIAGKCSSQSAISFGATPDFVSSPERLTSSSVGTVSRRAVDSAATGWPRAQMAWS